MNHVEAKSGSRPYHHGDLKFSLLTQAEQILEREGIQFLTLRAVARAAGVSHAAPTNHFGDLTGLLSELAALGFNRFAKSMIEAMQAGRANPPASAREMGHAYVAFAHAHPGMFTLMFRSERLDLERPALQEAIVSARQALRSAVMVRNPNAALSPLQGAAQAAAHWSLVHGFAMLALDGRLDGMIAALPGSETKTSLLDAMFDSVSIGS